MELVDKKFKIRYVLADSLYGESPTNFLRVLEKLKLQFMGCVSLSENKNHSLWLR